MTAYRANETTVLGDLLEHQRAGDRLATLAVFRELCQRAPELEGDVIVDEAWPRLVELGVAAKAVEIVWSLVAERKLARPRAVVHAVETARPSIEQLLELSTTSLECGLPVAPCLASIWFAILDQRGDVALWNYILRRAELLAAAPGANELVGLVMCTSQVGSTKTLVAWFDRPEVCASAPMWAVAAFLIAYGGEHGTKAHVVERIAASAIANPRDESFAILALHLRLAQLATSDDDKGEPFAFDDDITRLDRLTLPVLRYVAAARVRHPIALSAILGDTYPSPDDPNVRMIRHLRQYRTRIGNGEHALARFLQFVERPNSLAGELRSLLDHMHRYTLQDLAGFADAWRAAKRRHLPWWRTLLG